MKLSRAVKFKAILTILMLVGGAAALLTDNRAVMKVHANPEGAPGARTGAPGELTCTDCHSGGTSAAGQFSITAPANYTPNQTYQITVKHTTTDTTRRRWGFELTALMNSNNTKAGTLSIANSNTRVVTSGSRQYIEQTTAGTFANTTLSATWTFNWTAPSSDVGAITFYAAGLQCNNNGSESGDFIYTTTTVAQPASAGDFSLGSTALVPTVTAGANASYTITVTPSGGFGGAVSFNATGLPSGATASFAPTSVTGSGNTTLTITTTGATPVGTYPITVTGTSGTLSHTTPVTLTVNAPAPTVQFNAATYTVAEGVGVTNVTVTRSGDSSIPVTVDYATSDGSATQRTDYTTASGTLSFAAGETSKTFPVLITDDNYAEPTETVNFTLSNPTGTASLGSTPSATLTVNDNDIGTPSTNAIDDAQFFVKQHYADFLNRWPDQAGWDYWMGQITACGTDAACLNSRRIGVSAAYYIELEFQQTGSVVYRMYRAAFGSRPAPDQTRANLLYSDFTRDRAQLVGGTGLAQSTTDFANRFVLRSAFLTEYPNSMTNAQFVNHLFDQATLTPYASERQAEIDAMNTAGRARAQVLLNVINLQAYKDREYNPAFVLMQYFGYLRRDPDQGGYDFWLNVLNGQPANFRGMVCAFITSQEYQERFSSFVTRNNTLCNGNP